MCACERGLSKCFRHIYCYETRISHPRTRIIRQKLSSVDKPIDCCSRPKAEGNSA